MAKVPDTLVPRTPTLVDLVRCGMYDIMVRATELDPPPTNRGIQRGMKAVSWMCNITSMGADRPQVRAIRDTPEEAERDAKLRFMAIFDKGQKLDPVSENPNRVAKPKPKPVVKVEVELDQEAEDLI